MLNKKEVSFWLKKYFCTWPVAEARIFGSITNSLVKKPADVDLFIKYNKKDIARILELKKLVEEDFFRQFGYRLHLLVLSEEEAHEFDEFLIISLKNSEVLWRA